MGYGCTHACAVAVSTWMPNSSCSATSRLMHCCTRWLSFFLCVYQRSTLQPCINQSTKLYPNVRSAKQLLCLLQWVLYVLVQVCMHCTRQTKVFCAQHAQRSLSHNKIHPRRSRNHTHLRSVGRHAAAARVQPKNPPLFAHRHQLYYGALGHTGAGKKMPSPRVVAACEKTTSNTLHSCSYCQVSSPSL